VSVSKRLQFQQQEQEQAVDDDTILLRNQGGQSRVSCIRNVIMQSLASNVVPVSIKAGPRAVVKMLIFQTRI